MFQISEAQVRTFEGFDGGDGDPTRWGKCTLPADSPQQVRYCGKVRNAEIWEAISEESDFYCEQRNPAYEVLGSINWIDNPGETRTGTFPTGFFSKKTMRWMSQLDEVLDEMLRIQVGLCNDGEVWFSAELIDPSKARLHH